MTKNIEVQELAVELSPCYALPLVHGSLFSGIGGFDLAAEWSGWQNAFHCEWNKFGQKILKYYWPNAVSYGDITQTDFSIWRGKIDVVSGGFPCQPYSLAGKRLGKEDDRHLWPEMLRAIREIQPSYVVGENVFGLLNWNGGLVFDEVQADLENEGYEILPVILPACAVNAPHRRERIWFVAYSNKRAKRPSRTSDWIAGQGSKINDEPKEWREQTEQHIRCSDVQRPNSNAESKQSERMQFEQRETCNKEQGEPGGDCGEMGNEWDATNSERIRQSKQRQPERSVHQKSHQEWKASWTYDDGRWPTQSPICNGNDGVPSKLDGITIREWREQSIKSGGNAIVPQVAYEIFKTINAHDVSLR